MDKKIINIEINNSDESILTLKLAKNEIGTQYEDEACKLVFTRPEVFADDDLNIIFAAGKTVFEPITLGVLNEYVIPNTLTQETKLDLQVFFKGENGDMEFTNKITLTFLFPSFHQ